MGRPDEQHVIFAIQQKRVIFTQDADFLRLDNAGISHNGIVYCRPNSRSIGQIVRRLTLVWEYLDLEDMRGRVEFI